MTPKEKYNHILNDIYTIWMQHPNLTIIETIDLLRKKGLITRAQSGIKEYLEDAKKEFNEIKFVPDTTANLSRENIPLGSNPFMEDIN